MLKAFHPDAMVGWYDAAYGLVFSIMFISHGFKEAIVPSLTRTFASDPKQVEAWYYRTTKVLLLISLPIAVGGMLIASPLVHFLYSKEFANSALALSILVWDVPFLMFSSFCGSMTTIISQERSAARIYTVNALANIVLNAIFIPRYGFIAASFITVITDVIGAFQFFFLLHRQLNLPSIRWILARIVLASGMMGLAVVLLGGLHFILQVALGAVVYLFAVLALRLLDQTEWAFIRKLLGKVGLARFVKGWA
jgi:O-antigen/teichoic acid export membrane protein